MLENIKHAKIRWKECTIYGKLVWILLVIPFLFCGLCSDIKDKVDVLWNKLYLWKYRTFWILKRDKELYEHRNSNKG